MEKDHQQKLFGPVYFFVFPAGHPRRAAYQHPLVCLAEGLKEIGVSFYSNANYWRNSLEKDDYLFRHNPEVTKDDCAAVVMDQFWFCYGGQTPDDLFRRDRKYVTAYMDWADGHITSSWKRSFRKFDHIFRTHWNHKCRYPENFRPWAIGLSNRIIRETEDIPEFQNRRRAILDNTRLRHSLRKRVEREFFDRIRDFIPIDTTMNALDESPEDPYHLLFWNQTGRRHYPDYYRRLRQSVACACFSGFFLPPALPWFLSYPRAERFWTHLGKKLNLESKRVVQWDSWRLWEALAAGCVAIHLDFDKYGMLLPVTPRNWTHYAGIDLDNIEEFIDQIKADPESLREISRQGRQWALEYFSPQPTALRFLETVSQ